MVARFDPDAVAQAFIDRLFTMADLPPVSLPNVAYDGPPPYLEVQVFHNVSDVITTDGRSSYPGIFQVSSVVLPNSGVVLAGLLTGEVLRLFPVNQKVYFVDLQTQTRHSRVTRAYAVAGYEDTNWKTPVSINFETLV